MRRKLMSLAMGASLLFTGCSAADLANTTTLIKGFQERIKTAQTKIVQRPVTLTFLNRLDKERSVPLAPSLVQEIIFDGLFSRKATDYKAKEGVQEQLPFIETGEHVVEIKFKSIPKPVSVPIVIEEDDSTAPLFFIITTSLDLENNTVKEIAIGQDQNKDNQLDSDQDILKSLDGQQYLIHHPDGSVKLWISKLKQDGGEKPTPDVNQPLPPGAPTQTSGTSGADRQPPQTKQENTQTIEFKIPKTDVPQPKTPDAKPLPLPGP